MPLPELGVGIVYSRGLEAVVGSVADAITVVEFEPETTWVQIDRSTPRYRPDPSSLAYLDGIPKPKLVHSVSFPFGGVAAPPNGFFSAMADTVAALNPPWMSAHLSFNHIGGDSGFAAGFLLPAVQSPPGVRLAADNIARYQDRLQLPIAFETGVNYLRSRPGEIPDGEYFATTAEAADCGILLDLHNLWCNERNGRQSVLDVVEQLPVDRIWEIHVAGGADVDGYWVDAHSGLPSRELLQLAAEVVPRLPALRAILLEIDPASVQRDRLAADDFLAGFGELRAIWRTRGQRVRGREPRTGTAARSDGEATPDEWERTLGTLVLGGSPDEALATELCGDPAVRLYQNLIDSVRAGVLVSSLRSTCRLLALCLGIEGLRAVLTDFWRSVPPEIYAAAESANFAAYLAEHDAVGCPGLPTILRLELAMHQVAVEEQAHTVELDCNPAPVLDALAQGHLPPAVENAPFTVTLHPDGRVEPGSPPAADR